MWPTNPFTPTTTFPTTSGGVQSHDGNAVMKSPEEAPLPGALNSPPNAPLVVMSLTSYGLRAVDGFLPFDGSGKGFDIYSDVDDFYSGVDVIQTPDRGTTYTVDAYPAFSAHASVAGNIASVIGYNFKLNGVVFDDENKVRPSFWVFPLKSPEALPCHANPDLSYGNEPVTTITDKTYSFRQKNHYGYGYPDGYSANESFTRTLSNKIDLTAIFSASYGDFISQVWNPKVPSVGGAYFNYTPFGMYYGVQCLVYYPESAEIGAYVGDNYDGYIYQTTPLLFTNDVPGSMTHSLQTGYDATNVSFGNGLGFSLQLPVALDGNLKRTDFQFSARYGSSSAVVAANTWIVSPGMGSTTLGLKRTLGVHTAAIPMLYFVAQSKWRKPIGIRDESGNMNYTPSETKLLSSGWIKPNQFIGYNAGPGSIQLPCPDLEIPDFNSISIFAVIGQDSAAWALANGITLS